MAMTGAWAGFSRGPGVLIAVAPASADSLDLPAVLASSASAPFVRRPDELFDPLLKSGRDG